MNIKSESVRGSSSNSPERVLGTLMRAGNIVEQRIEDALSEIGLSLAKFIALSHLVEAGEPLSLSQCAARMTCVRSNVTQLMDRLEADGLVRRVEDPSDRRSVRAALTPFGMEKQAAGARQVAKVHKSLAKLFGDKDLAALERILSALD